ncbi:AraC family transcriptional regulator [Paenibacillus chartarius]|uniref:AraC family transcriptional regulator n=1 Tax=Paenibacillus chartarius TaxID=747481 RepID=A0ABV6DQM8_9BACL
MKRQTHFPTLLDQPYFCFPESVGRYTDSPEHSVFREAGTLNNYNIHFVSAGKGFVQAEGKTYELRRGDAVLHFPMSRQHYYSSQDEPWDVRWLHFYGGEPLHAYMLGRMMNRSPIWRLRQPSAWEERHDELLLEAERSKLLYPTSLSELTYGLIAEFVAQAEPSGGSGAASSAASDDAFERIVRLLPVMQAEACEPFTLEAWAAQAGVSTYYFCKLFRKATQMTPLEFITRCRLQAAKQWLLERKEAAIGAIARDAGYPSISYFNKKFLEYEGMTPSQYRKLYERSSD